MKPRLRTLYLAMMMGVITMVVGAFTTYMLYNTAIEQEKSRMFDAARHWQILLTNFFDEGGNITSAQIKKRLAAYGTSASHYGVGIVYNRDKTLHIYRFESGLVSEFVLPKSNGPYEISLQFAGLYSGTNELGENVLAIHAPIINNLSGLIVEKSWAHIRQPYYLAAVISILLALGLVSIGLLAFRYFSQPMLSSIEVAEKRFQAIFNSAVDAVFTINKHGIIQMVNPAACRMFGYHEEEFLGSNIRLIMEGEPHDNHDAYLDRYIETGIGRIVGIGREVEAVTKDGRKVPLYLTVSDINVGNERFFTGILHDISDLRRAETEVQELSQQIIEIQEEERDRISMELHDNLGTSLSLLKFMIQNTVNQAVQAVDENERAGHEKSRDELVKYTDEIVQTARSISHTLSPVGLKNLGLKTALERLVDTAAESKINFRLFIDDLDNFFHDNWDINLYRILQEALGNIVKHSRATRAEVACRRRVMPDGLEKLDLYIRDDGLGYESLASDKKTGMGIRLMQKRANMMGANFTIRRCESPYNGTEIFLEIFPGKQQVSDHPG